jgi:hypothetical protein
LIGQIFAGRGLFDQLEQVSTVGERHLRFVGDDLGGWRTARDGGHALVVVRVTI